MTTDNLTAQHTPGPWHINERGHVQSSKQHGDFFLASEGPDAYPADMTLIAAAPDLLAALEAVIDAINPGTSDTYTLSVGMDALEDARAAIRKARGED